MANSINIPSIDELFEEEITSNKLMESINQIQDKDLHPPVKTYIDDIAKINALYELQTEKKEVDELFDTMSSDISKIEKYKNVKTKNPDKMDILKARFSERSLKYAAKTREKEEQQKKIIQL